MIIVAFLFLAVCVAAVVATALATTAAVGIVVAIAMLAFGFAIPRHRLNKWWQRVNTIDERDPLKRTPLHRAADNFAEGWKRG